MAKTPVFVSAVAEEAPRRVPLGDVLRNHPRALLLSVSVGLGAFVVQGTLTTFLISAVHAGFARDTVLYVLAVSSTLAVIGIVGWSAVIDRFGRRPVVAVGAVVVGAYAFVLFPLVDSGGTALLVVAATAVSSVIAGFCVLAVVCVLVLGETSGHELAEFEGSGAQRQKTV